MDEPAQSARCAACGEVLDIGSLVCRVCGEDNAASASGTPFRIDHELSHLRIDPDVLDRLKPWSHIKHEIIEKYAHAYTTIQLKQPWLRRCVYIDAFAGAGIAIDAATDYLVAAGALRALSVEPPFTEYHFIESNPQKAALLREFVAREPRNATVHESECQTVLPVLLERCKYEDFSRGLCLLDPYGLTVDYALLQQIASTGTVEIFFNFMVVSANRNVLWRIQPDKIPPTRRAMMTRVWGHDRWPEDLYERQEDLFGDVAVKAYNQQIVSAYRQRLRDAGFAYVPEPIPMRNSTNAPIYYLFFCSPKAVAAHIVEQIFSKYR